ncbi:MAG TPA: PepSY-like domain-containing protein [Chitinophagaceae bacterium]|jgi:hypothetical protein|nr:PepSY-like domain-containing protein [Chitinophagaceae bacterium]
MKTHFPALYRVLAGSALGLLLASCQKDGVSETSTAASSSSTIAVAASDPTVAAGHSSDSVYLLQDCGRRGRRDSIAAADLPATATAYLTDNYAGYTFHKAFAVKDANGTVTGYVAVIYFNDKPVGVQFDAAGAFQRVLEQREKGDLDGRGHHHGGRFEHRDGRGRDSIALDALPAAVPAYFTAHYPTDTLVKAFRNRDSSIVVLSKNNGAFATVFTADGSFVSRTQLHTARGQWQPAELSALPSAVAAYLGETYPNYVFEKAFVRTEAGVAKGYVVLIDASNTKYALEFSATGAFLKARTIR